MKEPRWSNNQIDQFCSDVFDNLMQTLYEQEEQAQTHKESGIDVVCRENETGDVK